MSLTCSDWEHFKTITAHASAGDKQLKLIQHPRTQVLQKNLMGPSEHGDPRAVTLTNYSEAIIHTTAVHLHKQHD